MKILRCHFILEQYKVKNNCILVRRKTNTASGLPSMGIGLFGQLNALNRRWFYLWGGILGGMESYPCNRARSQSFLKHFNIEEIFVWTTLCSELS